MDDDCLEREEESKNTWTRSASSMPIKSLNYHNDFLIFFSLNDGPIVKSSMQPLIHRNKPGGF
jgi:hypothetical protein